MLQIERIDVNGKTAFGLKLELDPAPILLIRAKNGLIGCGFFNIEVANKLDVPFVIISGVKSISEMLEKKPVAISKKAQEMGITKEMTGREIVEKLS
ncbi:MAG: DUF1805 domain-containing protein [Candidatus Odinarchaeota archaeon]|nr:DUF1805 domain-containing protein [Candidatus Odinarchaeota archaeon]